MELKLGLESRYCLGGFTTMLVQQDSIDHPPGLDIANNDR
jgi:hypothetical protein